MIGMVCIQTLLKFKKTLTDIIPLFSKDLKNQVMTTNVWVEQVSLISIDLKWEMKLSSYSIEYDEILLFL